jgi:hypothetical protein
MLIMQHPDGTVEAAMDMSGVLGRTATTRD